MGLKLHKCRFCKCLHVKLCFRERRANEGLSTWVLTAKRLAS